MKQGGLSAAFVVEMDKLGYGEPVDCTNVFVRRSAPIAEGRAAK